MKTNIKKKGPLIALLRLLYNGIFWVIPVIKGIKQLSMKKDPWNNILNSSKSHYGRNLKRKSIHSTINNFWYGDALLNEYLRQYFATLKTFRENEDIYFVNDFYFLKYIKFFTRTPLIKTNLWNCYSATSKTIQLLKQSKFSLKKVLFYFWSLRTNPIDSTKKPRFKEMPFKI